MKVSKAYAFFVNGNSIHQEMKQITTVEADWYVQYLQYILLYNKYII